MTVKEYVKANPGKWSYTVRWARKSYTGNAADIVECFGNWELKSSEYRFGGKNCVLLKV